MGKITILILTRDRPLQFKDMVESIERQTKEFNIIICDNDSQQIEMKGLLKRYEKKYKVIYNNDNLLFEGLNPGLELIKDDYFVISDPDIILNKNMPMNWPEKMIETLERIRCPKVGLALNVDYDDINLVTWKLKENEKDHWVSKADITWIGEPCYYAAIDTTFAMYRRDTFTHWKDRLYFSKKNGGLYGDGIVMQFYNPEYGITPIRIAGNYTAEHGGWYVNKKYYSDYLWYKDSCQVGISSSLKNMNNFIEVVNENKEVELSDKIKKSLPDNFSPKHPLWHVPSYRNKYIMLLNMGEK